MSSREAACERCRKAKLGCDHERPMCTRCRKARKVNICVYRNLPFARKRPDASSQVERELSPLPSGPSTTSPAASRDVYPNPGHLGLSSHTAMFNHISARGDPASGASDSSVMAPALEPSSDPMDESPFVRRAAELLRELLNTFQLTSMKDLVMFWLAKGVNLALAGPFVSTCSQSMDHILPSMPEGGEWLSEVIKLLMQRSAQPLDFDQTCDIAHFSSLFSGSKTRLETAGLFVAALIRATFDVPFYPPLYKTEKEKLNMRKLCKQLNDSLLEICLSLDCLNDLQLIFQYENFIIHSYVEGDQSYRSWCRLGDVIASITALGFHENNARSTEIPHFLVVLRQTAFARVYSADKNIAIFLGRPLRMSKRFCQFQIPIDDGNEYHNQLSSDNDSGICRWHNDVEINYRVETCWSALCAFQKEEILELFCQKQDDIRNQRANIRARAEAQWQALPPRLRLDCSLSQSIGLPFERDFLVSTRLNHLHVLFLVRLLLLSRTTEPDTQTIKIAEEMLSLVVEAILLRDQLVNSGTGLIWKVAHYGLPAAGIILLGTLKQQNTFELAGLSRSKVLQDLYVLVAEVQAGSIIRPGEPNFALLSKATHTIQRFLAVAGTEQRREVSQADFAQPHLQDSQDENAFTSSLEELEFWRNLAEHPSLSALDFSF